MKWTSEAGWIDIGDLPGGVASSVANAVSDNGTIVVGESNSAIGREAFRWEKSTGITGLGHLPGHDSSIGHDVSADGSVIVGESDSTLSLSFRWVF